MNLELSDEQAAALERELHDIVESDKYPFSPRIRSSEKVFSSSEKSQRYRCRVNPLPYRVPIPFPRRPDMFVVVVSYDGVFQHLKVFSEHADAMGLARQCAQDGHDAQVYDVPSATNARAAKAAIEMGEGTLIAAPSRRSTQQELAEREEREREAQRQQSIREAAAWRVVRDFFGEHNALIDQNKPGIAKDINGNTFTTQVWLPESGRGSRKLRRKYIAAVLASQKPDMIRRFETAMAAILTEQRGASR